MTHDELVARAAKWLLSTKKCQVVITEMSSGAYEEPDAIGWNSGVSYLIECKTSMNDMLKDGQKSHRRHPAQGLGSYRYVMADKLLAHQLLSNQAKPAGWGLLSITGTRVLMLAESIVHVCNRHGEIKLLSSGMQRLITPETRGIAVRVYPHDRESPRASVYAAAEEIDNNQHAQRLDEPILEEEAQ